MRPSNATAMASLKSPVESWMRLGTEPDLNGLGRDISAEGAKDDLFRDAIVYLTCLHESGHGFGLAHTRTFADIMYTFQFGGDIVEYFQRYRRVLRSRADIAANSGVSPSDRKTIQDLLAGR